MPLTPEEKAERARQRMIDSARKYTTGTYKTRHVAPVFQRMIRAEAGLGAHQVQAVIGNELRYVSKPEGWCVCVTCGKVLPWSGGGKTRLGGMHTGHFIASRRNSIIFDEANVAPQCSACNVFQDGSPANFRIWMENLRPKEIPRLTELKNKVVQFTLEDLVDRKIQYMARLKAAEERMR